MKRSSIDKIISYIGLVSAAVLLAASAVLYGTYLFIHNEVSTQLKPQNITLPAEGSAAFNALPQADQDAVKPFAGQQVTTGQQAKVFADTILAHTYKKLVVANHTQN